VIQVMPANAIAISAAIAQANGTQPVYSSIVRTGECCGARRLPALRFATGLLSLSAMANERFGPLVALPVQSFVGVRPVRASRPCLGVHAVRPGRKVTARAHAPNGNAPRSRRGPQESREDRK
jgi:hypothetical protein